jgi:FkbM family methyltransferase
MTNSKSQIQQDVILDTQVFKEKRNGFFVEVGALDGFGASNTYFFEKERNWSGLLIEPNPIEFAKMANVSRDLSIKENCAISDVEMDVNFLAIGGPCNVLSGIMEFYNSQHLDRINRELQMYSGYAEGHELHSTREVIQMKAYRLETLFDKHNIKNVDLISIDVEGAELSVLKSINFDKVDISCFLIENNYGLSEETEFLKQKGYTLAGNIQWDCVFIKNNLING